MGLPLVFARQSYTPNTPNPMFSRGAFIAKRHSLLMPINIDKHPDRQSANIDSLALGSNPWMSRNCEH
jgi:hypothetical protein